MNVIEFLLARYAEEEAAAKAAGAGYDPYEFAEPFHCDDQGSHVGMAPARVLADVEAKRRVVAAIEEHQVLWETSTVREAVLYALASAYSTHPDYSQRWKP